MYIDFHMSSHIFLEIIEDPPSDNETASETLSEPEILFENIYQENSDIPLVENTSLSVNVASESPCQNEPVEVVVESPCQNEPVEVVVESTLDDIPRIPTIVFIVPYRNREKELGIFDKQMKYILEDYPPYDYQILYIHQKDNRTFNRGALKNIGFVYVKNKYPNDYQNMTLVFNDIDTMPKIKNFINYETTRGTIKHFYGFEFALGGIVSVNALDFERMNGFPNFWAWGYEDNMLQMRANQIGLTIDRTTFVSFIMYDVNNPYIVHLNYEGEYRELNRGEFDRFTSGTQEGIRSIKNIFYQDADASGMVNVHAFDTGTIEKQIQKSVCHISQSNRPYGKILSISKRPVKPVMNMRLF